MTSYKSQNLDAAEEAFLAEIHDRTLAESKADGLAHEVSEVISKALVELYTVGQRDAEALQRYAGYKARMYIIAPRKHSSDELG